MPHPGNQRQWSINYLEFYILGSLSGDWLQTVINEVLAAFVGKTASETLPAPYWKWVSTERQQVNVLHPG